MAKERKFTCKEMKVKQTNIIWKAMKNIENRNCLMEHYLFAEFKKNYLKSLP